MLKQASTKMISGVAIVCALAAAGRASAIDLNVSSIEVTQSVQFGTTTLVGGNVTWVRVKVGVPIGPAPINGVDGSLRLTIDGVPQAGSPIFSLNGPITAVAAPNSANTNDTINFACVPPQGDHTVIFNVEVNPNRNPVESDYSNNTSSTSKALVCRKTIECVGVPINYTVGGIGLPLANLIEPGIGDGFLRGIYKPGEWNYHISPLPPLNWTTDINSTSSQLQAALLDIRNNQLLANGQPKPNFVYGWFNGNPYSGNGQANGIPGDVGFGNTDPTRFQRTMAHEVGHLWGRSHNSLLMTQVGVDVEHHLLHTQNLPQVKAINLNDIMVAGLLTNQAWVAQATYDFVHANTNTRMLCTTPPPDLGDMPVLRISGVIDHTVNTITLDPVTRIESALPTANEPGGDTTVIALNAAGNEFARVTVRTGTARASCEKTVNGRPVLNPTSPLYVMLPENPGGEVIHTIRVVDVGTQQIKAERTRSANAPVVNINGVAVVPQGKRDEPQNLSVQWTGSDADGDSLTYTVLYSHNNGVEWLPLVVNTTQSSFEFDPTPLGADTRDSWYRVISTDGINVTQAEMGVPGVDGGGGGAVPATYLIAPNDGAVFPQKAPIAFHATSWDVEDKLLTGNAIQWTSSINGPIGTGLLHINRDLSPGLHAITVKGTDTAGNFTSKSVNITITPRTVISPDCNNNGVLDIVDISTGTSLDTNGNGIPDECENLCDPDVTGNGVVDIDDLLAVINAWGPCPGCPADVNNNNVVDIDDLLAVINGWGPCP